MYTFDWTGIHGGKDLGVAIAYHAGVIRGDRIRSFCFWVWALNQFSSEELNKKQRSKSLQNLLHRIPTICNFAFCLPLLNEFLSKTLWKRRRSLRYFMETFFSLWNPQRNNNTRKNLHYLLRQLFLLFRVSRFVSYSDVLVN